MFVYFVLYNVNVMHVAKALVRIHSCSLKQTVTLAIRREINELPITNICRDALVCCLFALTTHVCVSGTTWRFMIKSLSPG